MSWLILIILCAFFFGVVDIIDKYFCGNKIKSVYTISILTGIIGVVYVSSLFFFIPFKVNFGWPLILAAFSQVFYFFLWLCWWQALKTTEVSRSTAIYNSSPLYAAILAVIFLGEQLTFLKWLSIFLIVGGTIFCSYEAKKNTTKENFNPMYLLVILAAIFNSLGGIFSKAALETMGPYVVNIVAAYAGIPLFLSLLIKKEARAELKIILKSKEIIVTFIIRGFIAFLGVLLFYWALQAGPASLVIAGFGVNPLFTFLLSLILSRFFPRIIKENITRPVLLVKFLAILLIVSGVILINF